MTCENGQDCLGRPMADHVPAHLIRSLDWFADEPFELASSILSEEQPLVYTLCNPMFGQSWVPTRADIMRRIAGDPALFASKGQSGFAELIGENWSLAPLEVDPPDHAKLRKLISPWFSPASVAKLGEKAKRHASKLVDQFIDKKGCEFKTDFAEHLPVAIFLDLMGWPQDLAPMFRSWSSKLIHSDSARVRAECVRSITDYLRDMIAARRTAPQDDMTSSLVHSQIDGKELSNDELLGLLTLLFLGGLDSVTAALTFQFYHLARYPTLQRRLRARPEDIPKAIEEMLRFNGQSVNSRRATADTEIEGVEIKKGDWISLIWAVANRDGREHQNADVLNIDRANKRHMTFSFGPHFCIGHNLARREIQCAYDQMPTRLPPFRLGNPSTARMHGGITFGIDRLDLRWD